MIAKALLAGSFALAASLGLSALPAHHQEAVPVGSDSARTYCASGLCPNGMYLGE